jgi:hypothetical protein
MFPDALGTEEGLDSCEHIGEEAVYAKEALQRRYPKVDFDQIEATASPSAGIMESRFPGASSLMRDSERGGPNRRGIKVRELWSRDKHCVWIPNGKQILEEANPYPFLPYVMFSGFAAGRFWPDAPVTDMISPQTELNKTESQIAENAERFGNPAMLSPRSPRRATNGRGSPASGSSTASTPAAPPTSPASCSRRRCPYVQNRVPQIVESLNAISGQQEVAQGTVPSRRSAACSASWRRSSAGCSAASRSRRTSSTTIRCIWRSTPTSRCPPPTRRRSAAWAATVDRQIFEAHTNEHRDEAPAGREPAGDGTGRQTALENNTPGPGPGSPPSRPTVRFRPTAEYPPQ